MRNLLRLAEIVCTAGYENKKQKCIECYTSCADVSSDKSRTCIMKPSECSSVFHFILIFFIFLVFFCFQRFKSQIARCWHKKYC